MAHEITYNNFEISLVVFMPNITTNHAITFTNLIIISQVKLQNTLAALENLNTHNITRAYQEGFYQVFCQTILKTVSVKHRMRTIFSPCR